MDDSIFMVGRKVEYKSWSRNEKQIVVSAEWYMHSADTKVGFVSNLEIDIRSLTVLNAFYLNFTNIFCVRSL